MKWSTEAYSAHSVCSFGFFGFWGLFGWRWSGLISQDFVFFCFLLVIIVALLPPFPAPYFRPSSSWSPSLLTKAGRGVFILFCDFYFLHHNWCCPKKKRESVFLIGLFEEYGNCELLSYRRPRNQPEEPKKTKTKYRIE